MLSQVVYAAGVIFLLKLVAQFAQQVASVFATGITLKKCGKWAVITGCTDGIGKEYAYQLAAKGMSVVLIARNEAVLEEISKDIESKYSVETKVIKQDFSVATPADYKSIADEINALTEVGVLVNNVGISYDHPEFFDTVPIEHHRNLLDINCKSMVELTHAVLPGMVARKKGAIINISSISGLFPCPLLTTYGATKTFVAAFSDALNTEYKSKGIVVQSCVPAFVVSKMSKFKKPTLTVPTPKKFVQAALSSVGAGAAVCMPYWPHLLQGCIVCSIPDAIRNMYLMSLHMGIRAKALKKKKQG